MNASLRGIKNLKVMIATLLIASAYASSVSGAACRPDFSEQDKISKAANVKWFHNVTEVGFWKSMVVTDIDVLVIVGRYGDTNILNIQIVNKQNDRDRAAFDSRYRASQNDRFVFGFKEGGEPLTFTATEVNNQAQIENAQGLVMTVVLSAQLTDSDLARMRTALTTKQIDGVRIGLASGVIERSISDDHGEAMKQKFSCFYQYLDTHGVKLVVTSEQQAAVGAIGAADQKLDLVVEDILAQDKMTLQAILHHDMAYLDKHIASDAIFTTGGKQLTKRMLLAHVMEQQVPPAPVRTRYSSVSSKTTGDVVEVTSTATLSMQIRGNWKDFFEVQSTTKYKKIDGEWVMLASSNAYEKPLK
jgi:hypothetical protein